NRCRSIRRRTATLLPGPERARGARLNHHSWYDAARACREAAPAISGNSRRHIRQRTGVSSAMTDRIDADLASQEDSHLAVLLDFLRIPSISALPDHASDIQAAAEFVATALRQAGVPEVTIAPTEGWPSVIGRWQVSDDLPTVLIYGHFDVQPPDPLNLWESPAFEPALRDGRIYARGSSDMKANLLSIINTVAAFARIDGQPPLNLRFLFEGEEEIGSPNLAALI